MKIQVNDERTLIWSNLLQWWITGSLSSKIYLFFARSEGNMFY